MNGLAPILVCGIMLIVASILDLRSHTIPLYFFPITFGIEALCGDLWGFYRDGAEPWIAAGIILALLGLFVWWFHLGGADMLAGGCIGLALGYDALYVIAGAFLFCIPYTLYLKIKKKEREYAFLPFLTAAYGLAAGWLEWKG